MSVPGPEGSLVTDHDYDYVIVGGGSAGCVLAARLSEDPGARVLLLEAGSAEPLAAMTVPAAWPGLIGSAADWCGFTTPQADAGMLLFPQGRGLGGGGAVNAMAHVRGHQAVYDAWAAGGAAGWGYDGLLPYFKPLLERIKREDLSIELSTAGWRKPVGEQYPHIDLIRAAQEIGIPFTLASDAHSHAQLAEYYDRLEKLVRELGIREVASYEKHQRRMIPL